MKQYKAESNIMPIEWQFDTNCVFHNFNVEELTKDDEEQTKYFSFDVEEYTYQEYTLNQLQANNQAIDDIVISMLGE